MIFPSRSRLHDMEPLLRVINLSKRFGPMPAIRQVSFDIEPGEVVGLAGSIGSGKSVLVMVLAGLYVPNEGSVYFDNKRLKWPFNAKRFGIGVIHQKPDLADRMDVVENIFLGNEYGWPAELNWLKIPDRHRMEKDATRILGELGIRFSSLREKVSFLTSEERQMIAIARVLTQDVRLVIIDEPAISLAHPYQQKLLNMIDAWRKRGVAVLFSSNNLEHLFAITDRIITLHQGRKVADLKTDETNRETMIGYLMGSDAQRNASTTILDFDSYDRIRKQAEQLHYHHMLLEKDLAAQDSLNRQLVDELADHVQALDQANLALQDAQRRLLSEGEQERKHLARELHDQVIQDLISINFQLESIGTEHKLPKVLSGELNDVRDGIRELVGDLRQICGNLRPPTIDSMGLGAAIQSFTHEWGERTGITVTLNIDPKLGRLPEATELSIFRIVQEGLNNVWRHAKASSIQIGVQHTSPRALMVTIADDGLGFTDSIDMANLSQDGHFGLLGISERVALLGGRMRLQSLPEGGSLLQVEISHPRVSINLDPAS